MQDESNNPQVVRRDGRSVQAQRRVKIGAELRRSLAGKQDRDTIRCAENPFPAPNAWRPLSLDIAEAIEHNERVFIP